MLKRFGLETVSVVVLALLALGLTNNVQAECTQTAPGAKSVAIVDGTTGCASVNMQTGCRMDPASGVTSCTEPGGLFTATSQMNPDGSVSWALQGGSAVKADSVLVGGGTGGNACGYFYEKDAMAGSGMGFKKSNGQYANVTYVDVCTDGKTDQVQVIETLPTCPPDIQAALDDGTIEGDVAWVGKITDGDSLAFCVRQGAGIQRTDCINVEGKNLGPHPSGLPYCSQGPTGKGPQPFKKDISITGAKVGDGSCFYYCPPTNYSYGGYAACSYLCY